MFILDSHCDTPSEILKSSRDLSIDNSIGHVDFPKLKKGGVDGAFFALYIPALMGQEEGYRHAYSMLDSLRECVAANSDKAAFAVSREDAMRNKENGRFSVFLGMENGSPIGKSLDVLEQFYSEGVRYLTLCHSEDNLICDSCAPSTHTWNGLSSFGVSLVKRMNQLGMLIDVSHVSDDTFYDVARYSDMPFVATHSCCRALADHPRNMTDDMLRTLAACGGVIQINFYPVFLSNDWKGGVSYKRIIDHIDHAVEICGIDHVGIGSDFDGIEITPVGMENASKMSLVFDEMRNRGYSQQDIEKVSGGNFFRVLDTVNNL